MITKAPTWNQFQEITLIPFRLGLNLSKGLALAKVEQGNSKVHSDQKLDLKIQIIELWEKFKNQVELDLGWFWPGRRLKNLRPDWVFLKFRKIS